MDSKELLLNAYMKMEMMIRANRILNDVSMNQMFIMSYLYKNKNVTSSLLCKNTNLLKSQINRILNELKDASCIEFIKSDTDKRKTFITLSEEGKKLYLKEHQAIMKIFERIENEIGEKKTKKLANDVINALEIIKGEL